eukprot:gene2198-3100_t
MFLRARCGVAPFARAFATRVQGTVQSTAVHGPYTPKSGEGAPFYTHSFKISEEWYKIPFQSSSVCNLVTRGDNIEFDCTPDRSGQANRNPSVVNGTLVTLNTSTSSDAPASSASSSPIIPEEAHAEPAPPPTRPIGRPEPNADPSSEIDRKQARRDAHIQRMNCLSHATQVVLAKAPADASVDDLSAEIIRVSQTFAMYVKYGPVKDSEEQE